MKLMKVLGILVVLILMLSNLAAMGIHTSRAVEPQAGDIRSVGSPDIPDETGTAEWPSVDVSASQQDPQAVQPTAGQWRIETVDSEGWVGRDVSLALDEADRPHISYHDYTNDTLKYARYDGTFWHIETVDSVGPSSYSSLALDDSGYPHISYFTMDLKYAWYDGTTWRLETVDSAGVVGSDNSLALDQSGRPHISYHDDNNDTSLKYAWYDGGTWHISIVDSNGYTGWYTSLKLDKAGRPHISYQEGADNDLKYAWYDGTTWHLETVDSAGQVGTNTSLALDGLDHPHISYFDITNRALKYAWHDGVIWRFEFVYTGHVIGSTSLALDESGQPHIGYYDSSSSELKYAWRDGAAWHIETVDSDENVGRFASLALNSAGQPHIGYCDDTNYDLKYAHLIPLPSLSLNKQATPSHSLRHNGILTYTLTLSGSELSVSLWDPLPAALNYIPGSVTPPAVYSPTAHAIAWQGTLPADTVQVIRFQVTPNVTATRSLSSPLPIVNTAWMTDTYDRSVSAAATVNVQPPPLLLSKQAAPLDGLRNNDILTYTLSLFGPGLNARLWDALPPAVHYVSGSLASTLTPPAVYSATAHAILWQGTLPTDTLETVRFQVALGITGTGSLDLSMPIVNTAWLTATESGRSVSATVIVNGYHIYLPFVLRQSASRTFSK